MSKILAQIRSTQVVRDIKAILENGKGSPDGEDLRQRVLQTHWEVGRYLCEQLRVDGKPNLGNAGIIRHLAREFSQPKIYFDRVIRFYKCYPETTPDDGLSWAHYRAMLTAGDHPRGTGAKGMGPFLNNPC